MWQRFTESAKKTVVYAQQEAARMGTKDVASEHLLIGLLRQVHEQQGQVWPPAPKDNVQAADVASRVFSELGLDVEMARAEVARAPLRMTRTEGDFQLMPDAKQVIDLAYKEVRQLPAPPIGTRQIGTEHLLLGLIWGKTGLAGRILAQHGADLARARSYVTGGGHQEKPAEMKVPGFWSRLFGGGGARG